MGKWFGRGKHSGGLRPPLALLSIWQGGLTRDEPGCYRPAGAAAFGGVSRSSSSANATGLTRWWSNPASRDRRPVLVLAVPGHGDQHAPRPAGPARSRRATS